MKRVLAFFCEAVRLRSTFGSLSARLGCGTLDSAMASAKRITLVTDEILGVVRTAGAGTANTFLAFALARLGHRVEILLTGQASTTTLDDSWARQYTSSGIEIRTVDATR